MFQSELTELYQGRDANQFDMLAEMLRFVPWSPRAVHYRKCEIERLFGCYLDHLEVIEVFNLAGFTITSDERSQYMINMSRTEATFLATNGFFSCNHGFAIWRRIKPTRERMRMLNHFNQWQYSFMEYSLEVDPDFLDCNKEQPKRLRAAFEERKKAMDNWLSILKVIADADTAQADIVDHAPMVQEQEEVAANGVVL